MRAAAEDRMLVSSLVEGSALFPQILAMMRSPEPARAAHVEVAPARRVEMESPMIRDPLCLVRASADALADVEIVFDDLRAYSRRVDGMDGRADAARAFVTARPPGCGLRDKHAFVAYRHGVPIGLLDIIGDHPRPGTAFIGLLAVRESAHGAGLGRALYARTEAIMRWRLKARRARLAVVEANPVGGFWQAMGFGPTGEVKPYEGEAVRSRAVLMEKMLSMEEGLLV
ncbi:MAG: GNAT family N-acetyltransferase [Methylorubrum rhodinum]|uniref:GNAT family N-acetyltransferase n=1 Tax=Methylorubrum rhodinum TaxID=29428 RepID=UPI003BB1C34D